MVVLWWTLRTSLSKVELLASTLGARSLSDLEPLSVLEWPRDLEPLIVALNKLFARLEGAYELEQAFTDDVAHELRTPLAAIRAQAQLVRKISPSGLGDDVRRLVGMVDRANALIDGMMTLARLNSTSVSSRSVDVHALVAEVVAEALLNLPADAVEFTVLPDHVVRWRCDAALVQIALSAVIANAIQHAGKGRHIDIAVVRNADRLVVTIGDRGDGVPPAERERLMRRFEHGPSASSGSGLGLSIVSKVMTLLGGTIRLDARPDGPGLLVILTLPSAIG
jgi:signal transduction histidine kinase